MAIKDNCPMIKLAKQYYHTLRYLCWIQVKYRLMGMITKPKLRALNSAVVDNIKARKNDLIIQENTLDKCLFTEHNKFSFLNIAHHFTEAVDWNLSAYGKLWTYNLCYFEYLAQSNLTKEQGLRLINDFISKESMIKDGMDPYPISVRSLYWIKFLTKHDIQDHSIDQSLYRQLSKLSLRPEFHLMGNHLLENAIALFFSGVYFSDDSMCNQGQAILSEQLDEQILSDGAHFELSPMYHLILLSRLLDCYNLCKNNARVEQDSLERKIAEKCSQMLGWIESMQFGDGSIPHVNDSTGDIAPSLESIKKYANLLGLKSERMVLGESGYRKIRQEDFEALIDCGDIGPDYIPGHAHSDTFNFILHYRNSPFIVDTGISTYEKNDIRQAQRSTSAHNTVMVAGKEQSSVWGGFRVAERAKITDLMEFPHMISAAHDGYKNLRCIHRRSFNYIGNKLHIKDHLSNEHLGIAYLHFDPSIKVLIVDGEIRGHFGKIIFSQNNSLQLSTYDKALGFNKTIPAQMVTIAFNSELGTTFIPS